MTTTYFPWTLTFDLTLYGPGETEKWIGLPVQSQRDWRHRGYLPKHEAQARYTMFDVAIMNVMKMFGEQGKGPHVSVAHVEIIAFAMLRNALIWEENAWRLSVSHAFDRIPRQYRSLASNDRGEVEYLASLEAESSAARKVQRRLGEGLYEYYEKACWVTERLFATMNIGNFLGMPPKHAVWWPNNCVQLGDYITLGQVNTSGDKNQADPRFDGPALVLDLEKAAANFVRRAPSRLVSVSSTIADDVVKTFDLGFEDLGEIIVKRAGSDFAHWRPLRVEAA